MKKLFVTATAMMMACVFFTAQAQRHHDNNWKEKIKSEKIAFLTMEMDITPQEAQAFWPLYNLIEKERDAAFQNIFKTHKELACAVETDDADKISTCINNYHQAQSRLYEIDTKATEEYRKVLPIKKIAKLYLSEEKFRRHHIRKLREEKKAEQTRTEETSGK